MPKLPPASDLSAYQIDLVRAVAATSWLASPRIVKLLPTAVFPTVRARKGQKRYETATKESGQVCVYDDNTTPRWALLWSHGFPAVAHEEAYTFAHVWQTGDDIDAYTHVANVIAVPEPLSGLTDKAGPLVPFLRWHAWHVYGWKPNDQPAPSMPDSYSDIGWRYLETHTDQPTAFINERLKTLDNQRVRALRRVMWHSSNER